MHNIDLNPMRSAACVLLGVLLLCAAGYAQAGFGTCSNAVYLQRFDARLRGYDCVTFRQSGLVTPEGRRRVRVLHHRGAPPPPALATELSRGLEASVVALGRIGRHALYDISILLVHDVAPPPDTAAVAKGVARNGMATAECQITVYTRGMPSAEAAPTLAHELFHCVQAATFSPGQNRSYDGAGVWWTEGSAEWFASLAVPDPTSHQARADEFSETIAQRPLYRQSYSSLVFFLWLAQSDGPQRVMWFLAGMPQTLSEQAQRVALRDALGDAQWLQFAQDLADGRIRRPHGPPFHAGLAVRSPEWAWDRDRSDRLRQAPFTVTAVVAALDCGLWGTAVSPGRLYASRPPQRDGGTWAALPATIDTNAGHDRYLHLVTNTGDAPLEHRFEVRRQAGCESCGPAASTTDACVVGSWRETAGGSVAWLQQNMPAEMRVRATGETPRLTFRSDGMYVGSAVSASLAFQPVDGERGEGETHAQLSGRWSAGAGRLTLCMNQNRLRYQARVINERGTTRLPLPPPPPANDVTMPYTCRGDTLHTELAIPGGLPPMRTTYTREQ